MTFPAHVLALAHHVLAAARARGFTLATAESCTGGLIAGALTEIPGSSDVVDRGFVTYSNAAKTALLGVPDALIGRAGAVSEEVARAMAEGARARAGAGLAIAVTGIAGPGGATATKPVGRVHVACASADATLHVKLDLGDIGRAEVRLATVERALELALEALEAQPSAGLP